MQAREIIMEALKLRADERSEIVDQLLRSLDKPDTEVDRVWGEEAVRRAHALDKGSSKTYPIDDVLAEVSGTT